MIKNFNGSAGVYPCNGRAALHALVLDLAEAGYRIVTVLAEPEGSYQVIAQLEVAAPEDGRDTTTLVTKPAQLEELKRILLWYADQVRDCRKMGGDGDAARAKLFDDGGSYARLAFAILA